MNADIRTALVVEGGGMRGIFAAGVLDCFHEVGFDPFDVYYGVSAGACNLSSHLAHQYQRNYRCYTDYMLKPDFLSWSKFLRGGHLLDLDWFWEHGSEVDPLDVEAASRKAFYVVVTDVLTGEPRYLRANPETLLDALKGSSAVPILYRGFVTLAGRRLADGGIGDSIPVKAAIAQGAKRIMVLRSKPEAYQKHSRLESRLLPRLFARHPAFSRALARRNRIYNVDLEKVTTHPDAIV
jgi:predicted patatin/cPLA2 family phospholipase